MSAISDTSPDPFAGVLGDGRGGARPAREFALPAGQSAWHIRMSDTATVTMTRPDGWRASMNLPAQRFCQQLWHEPARAALGDGSQAAVNVSGEPLSQLRDWTAATIRGRMHLLPETTRARLSEFADAHAAHGRELVGAAERVKQAERELDAARDAHRQVWMKLQRKATPAHRVLCDMCGSTTRTRCGRLGCV